MIATTFLAIAALLLFATVFGALFKKLGLPMVVGQIFGGVLLGPTVLGTIAPQAHQFLFDFFVQHSRVFGILNWLGVILLVFISGFGMKLVLEKKDLKLISCLFLGSDILPFLAGIALFGFFMPGAVGTAQNALTFAVLFAISLSVTSVPVISKIFLDLKILNTRFAGAILTTSTLEDIVAWVLLSVVMGISSGNHISTTVLIVFALVAGIALKKSGITLVDRAVKKMEPIALSTFIPIYFALVGLRIDLLHAFDIGRFLIYFFLSMFIAIASVVLVMFVFKFKKDIITSYAISTSAKGGPGIVLAMIGLEYQIINLEFFTTLVLSSILSSLVAGLYLKHKVKQNHINFDEF